MLAVAAAFALSAIAALLNVPFVGAQSSSGECCRSCCEDRALWECYDLFLKSCNDDVQEYSFTGHGLTGTVPLWLGSLDNARLILLDGNELTGTVPDVFAGLELLEELDLSRNSLYGELPASICQLTEYRLRSCNVRDVATDANSFVCSTQCPTGCANLNCEPHASTTTEAAAVVDEQEGIQCPPPSGCDHSALWECNFFQCALLLLLADTGNVTESAPDSSSSGLTPRLFLDDRHIYGTIPQTFFPAIATKVTAAVWLGENDLSGTVPDLLHLLPTLTALSLKSNKLSGAVPPSIGSLQQLKILELGGNSFAGPLPASVCALHAQLEECGLSNEAVYVDCSIPSCAELVRAEVCRLECDVPATTAVALSDSSTSEAPPAQAETTTTSTAQACGFGRCRDRPLAECTLAACPGDELSSGYLDLSGRRLTGSIPQDGALAALLAGGGLNGLDLSFNQLTGRIPSSTDTFWTSPAVSSLLELSLAHNRLSGTLPPALGSLTSLKKLDLAGNIKFTGSLPRSICSLEETLSPAADGSESTNFNLPSSSSSSSSFSSSCSIDSSTLTCGGNGGKVFQQCGSWLRDTCGVTQCRLMPVEGFSFCLNMPLHMCYPSANDNFGAVLNLEDKQLWGTIPARILEDESFHTIELDFNELTGPVPNFNNSVLRTLDLNDNALDGTLPNVQLTGGGERSYAFDFSNNMFTGTIPGSFTSDPLMVNIFNLANNQLSGSIPSTFCANLFDRSSSDASGSSSSAHFCDLSGNANIFCETTLQNFHCGYAGERFNASESNEWCGVPCTEQACATQLTQLPGCSTELASQAVGFADCPMSTKCRHKLEILQLTDNTLTGTLPAWIGSLSTLDQLLLDTQPALTGVLPASLQHLTLLSRAQIRHTGLSGSLDPVFGIDARRNDNKSTLKIVEVSDNYFDHVTPSLLGSLAKIVQLDLSRNHLDFNLSSFCSLRESLEFLSVATNDFSGSIEDIYCADAATGQCNHSIWPKLALLDVSCNELDGIFPPQINPPRGCAPSLSCLQDEVFPAMTEIDIRRNTIQIRSNRLVCATAVEPNAAAYLLADGAPAMPGGDNFVLCDTGGDDEPGCFFPDEGQANWIYGSGSGGLEVNSSSTCGSSGASCRAFADAYCTTLSTLLSGVANSTSYHIPECQDRPPFAVDCSGFKDFCAPSAALEYDECAGTANFPKRFAECDFPYCDDAHTLATNDGLTASFLVGPVNSSAMWDMFGEYSDIGDGSAGPGGSRYVNMICANVTNFFWSGNALSGTLPSAIGSLSTLEQVLLGDGNIFTGELPRSLQSLSALRTFDASDNAFTGRFPMRWNNNAAASVDVCGALTQPFPALENLLLPGNLLQGSLPSNIHIMSKLQVLDLSHNSFSATLPAGLGSLMALRHLSAASNALSGTIPASLGSLGATLTDLQLANNSDMSGCLPLSLSSLSQLRSLDMSGLPNVSWDLSSRLCPLVDGSDGDSIQHCALDSSATFYCAQIDGFGTDSSCVAAFVSKCGVDASDCRVIESCGEAFSVCYGKQNEFYGNSMGGCDAYDLGFCDLRACVDNGAFNLRSGSANTEFMDFNLLGTIPEAIAVLSDVTSVDFKEVALGGTIPPAIGSMSLLTRLTLDACSLTGTIPASLGSLQLLVKLQLRNNQLTGTIPSSLGSLSHLVGQSNAGALYLDGNLLLTGQVPRSFEALDFLETPAGTGVDCKIETQGLLTCAVEGYCFDPLCATTTTSTLAVSSTVTSVEQERTTALGGTTDRSPGCGLALCHQKPIAECGLEHCADVYVLNLNHRNLTGTIPAGLWGARVGLQAIDLSFNQLTGTLPSKPPATSSVWSELAPSLSVLNLHSNRLSGTVPAGIGNLTALRELDLAANEFSGHLSANLCTAGSEDVDTPVDLEWCDLRQRAEHNFDCLGAIVSSQCAFALGYKCMVHRAGDRLANKPVEQCTITTTAAVDSNTESATTPALCDSMSVACSNTEISDCPILDAVSGCELGSVVNLRERGLHGGLPQSLLLQPTLHGIESLDLSSNQLNGTVPSAIGSLIHLRQLILSNNGFSGTLPLQLASLSSLEVLLLDGNRLTGTIPESIISALPSLSHLFLDGNSLSGTVPASICSLEKVSPATCNIEQSMAVLFCGLAIGDDQNRAASCRNGCHLGCVVVDDDDAPSSSSTTDSPSSICPAGADFGRCSTVSECFEGCSDSQLKRARVVRDGVTGTIPTTIGLDFPAISYLDLGDNFITGNLPASLGSLKELTYVDLSMNELHGSIPWSFSSLAHIVALELNNNGLTGPLASSFLGVDLQQSTGTASLEVLHLAFNELTGSIPFTLGSFTTLQRLSLNGNLLDGFIPESFCHLTRLVQCELPNGLRFDCNSSCLELLEGVCDQDHSDCEQVPACQATDGLDADSDLICGDVDSCPGDNLNDADIDGLCYGVDSCALDPENDADSDNICGNMDSCPWDEGNDGDSDLLCETEDSCPQHAENDPDQDGTCDSSLDASLWRFSPYLSDVEFIIVVAVCAFVVLVLIIVIIVVVCVGQRAQVNAQNVDHSQHKGDHNGIEMQESPVRNRLYVTTTAAEGSNFDDSFDDDEVGNRQGGRGRSTPLSPFRSSPRAQERRFATRGAATKPSNSPTRVSQGPAVMV